MALTKASSEPPGPKICLDLVHSGNLVTLPQVEVVGLHAAQRLLELPHGAFGIALFRLAHQQDLLAESALKRQAVEFIALAFVVLVRTVEKIDAQIDRPVDDLHGVFGTIYRHMKSAEAKVRDFEPALAEGAHRHRSVGGERYGRAAGNGSGDSTSEKFTALHGSASWVERLGNYPKNSIGGFEPRPPGFASLAARGKVWSGE